MTKNMRPTARNVFIIQRVSNERLRDMTATQYEADNILHFGEPFHLECNPSLLVDERTQMLENPKYLASAMKTATNVTRLSNRQMVYMAEARTNDAVWVCLDPAGGADRLLSKGAAVEALRELVLQHRGTGQKLCADAAYSEATDFGPGYEVACATRRDNRRQLSLAREGKGDLTGETLDRPEGEENRWIFVTADTPAQAEDKRRLPPPLTSEALIQKVIDILKARGEGSIRGLRRSFRIMDDGRDQKLDREDFKWGLKDYGVHLNDRQFDVLLDYFDDNKDGLISINEFLNGVAGPMNERRADLVRIAYERLDKNCDGEVTRADIRMAYDVSENPKVVSGEWTVDEAIENFMALWETEKEDGHITLSEFMQYYSDLSAEIEDDDYFELMIRNAWHISGGEGWAANSSCLRVLVTYTDDSQEVVECQDDLGLDTRDTMAIIEHLERQGVQNIKSVSVADAM